MNYCSCTAKMDIRGRCCPYSNHNEFKYCKAKIDTALFHYENDYECYKKCELNPDLVYDIMEEFGCKMGLNNLEIEKLIDLYNYNLPEENMD